MTPLEALREARMALEPFAKDAELYEPGEQDGKVLDDDHYMVEVELGWLRRAASALAAIDSVKDADAATPGDERWAVLDATGDEIQDAMQSYAKSQPDSQIGYRDIGWILKKYGLKIVRDPQANAMMRE